MVSLVKADWWDNLASYFSFSNDGSSTIDSADMFADLYGHVEDDIPLMLSSSFLSGFSNDILEPSSSKVDDSNILIPLSATDVVIGYDGFDFLAGTGGDNILYGGQGHDFFSPGGGIDLIIGSEDNVAASEVDTVGYLMAAAGVTVDTEAANLGGGASYFSLVSDDGDGAYDVLYSVENIFGSDHGDVIHGHTVLDNTLWGGIGNDTLNGEGGDDTLIGGAGLDTVDGGSGDDLIMIGVGGDQVSGGAGADIFKFDATIGTAIAANTADIFDFETGASGDVLDVAEILGNIGYDGADPLADGTVQFVQSGDDTIVKIDADGTSGGQLAENLAVLHDVQVGDFSTADNLVTSAPTTLLVSILGQSNAQGLRVFDGDSDSGITRIQDMLEAQTDYTTIATPFSDENGDILVAAVGGTRVDGNSDFDADEVWWFPDEGLPGEILVRAVEMLAVQITDLRSAGAVKPVIVWGQGESDAVLIGDHGTEPERLAAQDRYMNATLSVFDYIKDRLGDDIEFYIMQTGRYHEAAALAKGFSQSDIDKVVDGLTYIRAAQDQMALDRDDIHMAVNYTDLPMYADVDPVGHGTDRWHLHPEERELIGDRIGDFIALELGYDHILDSPGAYPLHMLTDLDLKAHAGMTINGNANDNIVVGTLGDDVLTGGAGDDALYGGAGFDEVLYGGNFADYTLLDDTWITVTDNVGADGVDTLIEIEKVGFTDGFFQGGVFTPFSGNINPVARDDVFSGDQDVVITGNVLADNGNGPDSDADGDPLSVVAGTYGTAHGSMVLLANGDFTYTPDVGYVGTDSFTYTLEDGQGGSDTADVTWTLNSTGGGGDIIGTSGNDVLSGTANDDVIRGLEGDDTLKGREGADTLFGGDGDDTLWGNDGDDTLQGGGGSDWMKGSGGIDTFVYTSIGDAGDTIVDFRGINGEKIDLTALLQGISGFDPVSAFADGYVRVAQNGPDVDVFVDLDATAGGGSEVLLVNILGRSVTDVGPEAFILPAGGGSGNTDPVAQDDVFSGDQDVVIAGNVLVDNGNGVDSDSDGDPLSVVAGTYGTAHGSMVLLANGDFTYTPDAGYVGTDSFTYTLEDGQGGSDMADVTWTLNSTGGPAALDFDDFTISDYGVSQNESDIFVIEDGGATLHLSENTWKKIDLAYVVTSDTVLEFDFKSNAEGEIHGIGFDTNDAVDSTWTFRVFGTQDWAISDFANYGGMRALGSLYYSCRELLYRLV